MFQMFAKLNEKRISLGEETSLLRVGVEDMGKRSRLINNTANREKIAKRKRKIFFNTQLKKKRRINISPLALPVPAQAITKKQNTQLEFIPMVNLIYKIK